MSETLERDFSVRQAGSAPLDLATSSELTYASAGDSIWVRGLIRCVEFLAGTRKLQRLYNQIDRQPPPTSEIWGLALRKLRIRIDYDATIMESVPRTGPIVFVANHPFGVVDGLILCHLISRVRDDFFLLVNESVMPQPLVAKHLLPIDFHPTKAAIRTNLNTKRATTQRLRDGESLAIFPSGMVATSSNPWGPAIEQPWNTFVSRRIHEAKCTVVPIYFHGSNSRLFQLVSQVSTNVRLGLLMYEVRNKIGKRIQVEIGEPIPYADIVSIRDAQALVDHLRRETMGLANRNRRQRLTNKLIMPLSKLRSRIRRKTSNTELSVSP